jgi:hypothetical protein
MKTCTKYVALAFTLMLIGCATPIDVHSASTAQLQERRTEIDRKLKEDDLGVAWGVSRWISHAHEKDKVLKEKQAIDAELALRHIEPRQTAASSSQTTLQ